MKKYYFIKLSYLFVFIVLLSSCHQIDDNIESDVQISQMSSDEFELKLKELSFYMGEVLKDPNARQELFDFAKIEGNEDDIEYNLKNLFEENENPISRKKSAIVDAFRKSAEKYRTIENDFNPEELIEFIKQNNIGVLAPYLYKNFEPNGINELTVSWWTQEMENEGYAKDPNWLGETPGYVFPLSQFQDFISFRINEEVNSLPKVMANDEYAKINPTVVFGAFENSSEELETAVVSERENILNRINYTTGVPINLGIGCSDVLPSDIVRYHMPQFRLTENTRGWPNPNRVSIWVAYGDYSTTSGVPSPSVQVNLILNDQKIDRGDFNWQQERWPVLMTSWPAERHSIQIIVAHRKTNRTLTQTTQAITINPSTGAQEVKAGATVSRSDYKLFFSQTWYRCSEIEGAHTIPVPPLNTTRLGNAIWRFTNSYGAVEFTLEPRLTRF